MSVLKHTIIYKFFFYVVDEKTHYSLTKYKYKKYIIHHHIFIFYYYYSSFLLIKTF